MNFSWRSWNYPSTMDPHCNSITRENTIKLLYKSHKEEEEKKKIFNFSNLGPLSSPRVDHPKILIHLDRDIVQEPLEGNILV